MPGDRSIEETRLQLKTIAAALEQLVDTADNMGEHLIGAKLAESFDHTSLRLSEIDSNGNPAAD
jgi:hypothetical protein